MAIYFKKDDYPHPELAETWLYQELMGMKDDERQEKMIEWLTMVIGNSITRGDELSDYIPGSTFLRTDW